MTATIARLPIARLLRTPRVLLGALAWAAVAIGAALVIRRAGGDHTADTALLGGFAAFALPLAVYVVVAGALGGTSLARSGRSLVAFGARPSVVALTSILVAVVAGALVAAILGAVVAAIAHGPADPPLARDGMTSAYAGALGGAAYAAYFALGSTFGARGGGRAALLVVDLLVGSGTGVLAMLTPRAHVASLLGAAGPLGVSGRASAIALVVLAIACGGLAVFRARR